MHFPSLLALGIAFLSAPASAQSCDGFTCNGAGIAAVSDDEGCRWACESCIPGRSYRDYYWNRSPGVFEQCLCGDVILCTSDLERNRPPPRDEAEITFQCRDGAISMEMMDGPCPRSGSRRMQSMLRERCGRSGGSWSCRGSGSGGRPSRPPPPPRRNGAQVTYQCRDGAISAETMDTCSCPGRNNRRMRERLSEACGRSGGSWSCESCDYEDESVEAVLSAA